jgi:hypothetical protein
MTFRKASAAETTAGRPLPADLFGGRDEVDDDWGDFAAPSAAAGSQPQLPGVAAHQPALAAAQAGDVRRGDAVWYLDGRLSTWVEAKVSTAAVDAIMQGLALAFVAEDAKRRLHLGVHLCEGCAEVTMCCRCWRLTAR